MKEQHSKTSILTRSSFQCGFILLMLMGLLVIFQQMKSGGNETYFVREKYPKPKSDHRRDLSKEKNLSMWTDRLLQCGYQIHTFTPEERSEGTVLTKMIEWPKPPNPAVHFMKSSDPSRTRFVILNSAKTFYVGDQLQVMLRMYDFEGNPKQYGGDYLQARIHTPELKAGSVGTVIDHQNGFYYINFTLLWPGKVQVSVSLVHPSEGIQILQQLRNESQRVYFRSTFKLGKIMKSSVCNLCLKQTKPLCDFTDIKTGEPWFCYKPEKLPCSSRLNHATGYYVRNLLNGKELKYFQSGKNVKMPILPNNHDDVIVEPSPHKDQGFIECVPGKPLPSPSGFYYQDKWVSQTCCAQHFDISENATNCLRWKNVYLHGDSTMRQWFEYLIRFMPGLRKIDVGNSLRYGPHLAVDVDNTIKIEYFAHGIPIRIPPLIIQNLLFIANKLDDIKGGKNTVVALTIWSHFSTFPVEHYIRRLQNIRRSILRLLDRSPETLIVIKTANVQALPRNVSLYSSDWFSYQLDLVMRRIFQGINVAFVDAWEMTLAHYLPHEIHPKQIIVKNQVDMFLSYVCPLKK
ncbi:NXPE family member 3-like [Narcine bancroftii]|uniref:NXPE family member 3-like n=1 Tax=Narcine bancroftii TaxID=1343680 RepID=UPI0038320D71